MDYRKHNGDFIENGSKETIAINKITQLNGGTRITDLNVYDKRTCSTLHNQRPAMVYRKNNLVHFQVNAVNVIYIWIIHAFTFIL
jgi:hypothetical protein